MGRRRRCVMEGGRAGGGGVRQYHSSNIFHPLRPSSEPLLVGDRSDLISHMTLTGRRSGRATREADYLRPRLPIRRLLTRGEPRLSRPLSPPPQPPQAHGPLAPTALSPLSVHLLSLQRRGSHAGLTDPSSDRYHHHLLDHFFFLLLV